MNIVFVSNFLNHHQIPLCQALMHDFDNFVFIATAAINNVGYQKASSAPYLLQYQANKTACKEIIQSSDVVIFGDCPDSLIALRMIQNKLSFLFSERFLKKGIWRRFIPTSRRKIYNRTLKFQNKNFYVLCASAYLSYDLTLMGFPAHKCFKWGYFPQMKRYQSDEILKLKSSDGVIRLIWVARLIPLKHPEHVIELAKILRNKDIPFTLEMIGDGILKNSLQNSIKSEKLENFINLAGSLSPEEVRLHMEKADIFIFSSDFHEGWGAVVNEAMNSACAVVCSHAAGCANFLIHHDTNGLIYESGNIQSLYDCVKALINDKEKRRSISLQAYKTIITHWNADIASSRLKKLINGIQCGKADWNEQGVCSQANVINPNYNKHKEY